MKKMVTLLRIAGMISLLFMLFHLLFYRMFHWENSLACLSPIDKSIMLTYHYISILILFFMGVIPLFQGKHLLGSNLKYSVLGLFALFYLIRIITEFTLFGIGKQSPFIIALCAIPMICFAVPLIMNTKKP